MRKTTSYGLNCYLIDGNGDSKIAPKYDVFNVKSMQRIYHRYYSVAAELAKRGIVLPQVNKPVGNYVSLLRSGNHLYLSGALPLNEDGSMYKGKVGQHLDEGVGYQAARRAAMVLVSNILLEVTDLSKVRINRITGYVNCTPEFESIPAVVNGASDFLVEIFGENGKHHARSAVGVASLPLGVPVEIEAIVEILSYVV